MGIGQPGMKRENRHFDNKSSHKAEVEDHFLAETVDPQTLEPVPLGEKGELVFTSLQRRAMPMIRYRTKDITRLWREPGHDGRTFIRMDKVTGRSDDMLIISGVNVFPSQIESLLLDIEEVEPQYRLVVRKKGYCGLADNGVQKMKEGLTTAEEVFKVTFMDDISQ